MILPKKSVPRRLPLPWPWRTWWKGFLCIFEWSSAPAFVRVNCAVSNADCPIGSTFHSVVYFTHSHNPFCRRRKSALFKYTRSIMKCRS